MTRCARLSVGLVVLLSGCAVRLEVGVHRDQPRVVQAWTDHERAVLQRAGIDPDRLSCTDVTRLLLTLPESEPARAVLERWQACPVVGK